MHCIDTTWLIADASRSEVCWTWVWRGMKRDERASSWKKPATGSGKIPANHSEFMQLIFIARMWYKIRWFISLLRGFGARQTLAVITSVELGTEPRSHPKGSDKSVTCIQFVAHCERSILYYTGCSNFLLAAPYALDRAEKHLTKPRPNREEWLQYLTISNLMLLQEWRQFQKNWDSMASRTSNLVFY